MKSDENEDKAIRPWIAVYKTEEEEEEPMTA